MLTARSTPRSTAAGAALALMASLAAAGVATGAAPAVGSVPAPAASTAAPAPLGVTYAGWKGDYAQAPQRLAAFRDVGFKIVSLVPTYAYEGLSKIDLASGPDAAELAGAVESALRLGLWVVMKPHLDPPIYRPAFDAFRSENHSWRVHCAWRGFFDVDPMSDAYRTGIVFASLRAVKSALDKLGDAAVAPVRIDLGAELMNSVVHDTEQWTLLLAAAKKERRRLGLEGKVQWSHNFSHHFEILDDFVGRMKAKQRATLARYIRGLDAVAVSQYMDLTAAMAAGERGRRLPTVDEVALALLLHEKNFKRDILQGALGLRAAEIPPLHIGEFGVGRGGLRHPNLWDGAATPAEEKELAREIARGHEGLMRYLANGDGRTAKTAILWVTGPHYDIFGWQDSRFAIPDAAAAIKAGLRAAMDPAAPGLR